MACCSGNNNCRRLVYGPPGPQGPPGPPGPAGAQRVLRGIQLRLSDGGGDSVQNNGAVVFDTIVNNQSPITYNFSTGELSITVPGNYYLSWWIAINGALADVTFAIRQNGGGYIPASMPVSVGQLNGNALITVGASGASVALVNRSGAAAQMAGTPVQASLTAVYLSV